MLVHIDHGDVAERVRNTGLKTLEDGIPTTDIAGNRSVESVGICPGAGRVGQKCGRKSGRSPRGE